MHIVDFTWEQPDGNRESLIKSIAKNIFTGDVKCCSIDEIYMQIRTETDKANKWWLKLHNLYVRTEEEMATLLKLGHKTAVVDRNKYKCLFFAVWKFQ